MKDEGIRISPKHGLNPAIPKCFYCLQNKNEIILAGMMKPLSGKGRNAKPAEYDPQAPQGMVWDKVPCCECAGFMEKGIILISALDSEEGSDNPYRTGGWVVVTDGFIRRLLGDTPLCEDILKRRVAFLPDKVWDQIGLPRGEKEEEGT